MTRLFRSGVSMGVCMLLASISTTGCGGGGGGVGQFPGTYTGTMTVSGTMTTPQSLTANGSQNVTVTAREAAGAVYPLGFDVNGNTGANNLFGSVSGNANGSTVTFSPDTTTSGTMDVTYTFSDANLTAAVGRLSIRTISTSLAGNQLTMSITGDWTGTTPTTMTAASGTATYTITATRM